MAQPHIRLKRSTLIGESFGKLFAYPMASRRVKRPPAASALSGSVLRHESKELWRHPGCQPRNDVKIVNRVPVFKQGLTNRCSPVTPMTDESSRTSRRLELFRKRLRWSGTAILHLSVTSCADQLLVVIP